MIIILQMGDRHEACGPRLKSEGTITGVQSGLCLEVTGNSTPDGALAELWTCNGGSNQHWTGP